MKYGSHVASSVIASASEAIHLGPAKKDGLLRRFTPRNDESVCRHGREARSSLRATSRPSTFFPSISERTWMPGTRPGMTQEGLGLEIRPHVASSVIASASEAIHLGPR